MIFQHAIQAGTHRRVKEDVQAMTPRMWEALLWLRSGQHPYKRPRREVIDRLGMPTLAALSERRLLEVTGYFGGKRGNPDSRKYGLSRLGVVTVQAYIEGQKSVKKQAAGGE